MTRCVRRAAVLCLLLLLAPLVAAARIQVLHPREYAANPADRRPAIARYSVPRGDILVDGTPVTGSRDTGEPLRYERTYADGPLFAPVTGYSSQRYGTSLLEAAEDGVLSGTDPRLASFSFLDGLTRPRRPGADVHTTVRAAVQRAAYEGLEGKRGAVAAVEPATGRILAVASAPSYDPALLSGNGPATARTWDGLNADAARPMLNRALRQTYPPGSAFKVVTAAAALDSGLVRDIDAPTDSPLPYTLPGTAVRLGNAADGCEDASLRYAFAVSCNTVFARLGARTGVTGMAEAAERFGFNDAGLRIPAKVTRSNFDRRMEPSQVALSSIGQFDTSATPLQMAMVAAAVANGGEIQQPRLVDRVTTPGGRTVATTRGRSLHQAMSPSTALLLQRMMRDVVTVGSGRDAAIPGVEVGGKTGTAQHGVGNAAVPYAWFIGWAEPEGSFRPTVAVAVVVEDADAERADFTGGGLAAPIAREVMRAAVREADGVDGKTGDGKSGGRQRQSGR
ncbi:penicillin-binding transpeptidase domain-containing protein [Streptomyces meridianus]|uniref:Penicillin-binding transpeptidase domain-containing protein n=1 Tax=Streptomyces meridianus TaxID=2938945 RepID=A0ABT0X6Q2_9ACTN|nr:penicillin-binding transpeptidase domain-containing protein [Streptomyces meridianus]MCM2578191.1 penicillin-binding transpeptidase domain-containing protein [Streptomyces meridianus]